MMQFFNKAVDLFKMRKKCATSPGCHQILIKETRRITVHHLSNFKILLDNSNDGVKLQLNSNYHNHINKYEIK